MIIDIHGHYTTEPQALLAFRDKQLAGLADPMRKPATNELGITDEQLIKSVEPQMKLQKERGSDLTIFSPRAAGMAHHVGTEATGIEWSRMSNDLISGICTLLPDNFAPVGQLPQHPGVPPKNCIAELERLAGLGFVGVNLNPDPAGGYWTDPPLTDKWWYPLYEKLCELEMTAMIHVTSSCNPVFHYTGAHYINGDTTAFMQLVQGNLFKDFPTLRFVIPHGGGAVPFHWGRYRGLAQEMKKPLLKDHLLGNVFFDTCVYHLPGIELMAKVIPVDNILFASEMLGAVKGVDPETGHNYDDTKRYIDKLDLSAVGQAKDLRRQRAARLPALERPIEKKTKVAIAIGDPGGIGPEVSLKAALDPKVRALCNPVVIGSGAAIKAHAQACGLQLRNVEVLELGPAEFTIGEIHAAHGRAAIAAAQRAIRGAAAGDYAAVVAAPHSETAIHAAGIEFDGYASFVARTARAAARGSDPDAVLRARGPRGAHRACDAAFQRSEFGED